MSKSDATILPEALNTQFIATCIPKNQKLSDIVRKNTEPPRMTSVSHGIKNAMSSGAKINTAIPNIVKNPNEI